jgi:hypothetical protein
LPPANWSSALNQCLLVGGRALGLGGGSEHLDGASHFADLVIAMRRLAPGTQIAGGHRTHNFGGAGQRIQHMPVEQTQGLQDEAYGDQACQRHDCHHDLDRGRAGGDQFGLRGSGMVREQQNGSALALEDRFQPRFTDLRRCGIAARKRRHQDLVDLDPESISFLCDLVTQFARELWVDIIGGPTGKAAAVLLFKRGEIASVLAEMGGIFYGLLHLEHRFDDIERRGQDIGVEARDDIDLVLHGPAHADVLYCQTDQQKHCGYSPSQS